MMMQVTQQLSGMKLIRNKKKELLDDKKKLNECFS
jgi:hypothetical protein